MTETEQKVIDILIQHGEVRDAWTEPIHAVDRKMGWATASTTKVVQELMDRKLIRWCPIVVDGPVLNPKACWKKGPAHPTEQAQ